jgi:hypothetical protein
MLLWAIFLVLYAELVPKFSLHLPVTLCREVFIFKEKYDLCIIVCTPSGLRIVWSQCSGCSSRLQYAENSLYTTVSSHCSLLLFCFFTNEYRQERLYGKIKTEVPFAERRRTLLLGRSRVQISAQRPTFLTAVLRGFPQPRWRNCRIVHKITPRPFYSASIQTNYSLIILLFDAI